MLFRFSRASYPVIPAKAGTQNPSPRAAHLLPSGGERPVRVPAFAGMTAWVVAAFAVNAALAAPPVFEAVRAQHTPSDHWLQDRNGEPLQRIRVDKKVRRTEWVKLDDISPVLIDAVLASEDKRFFDHGGVDWRATASAAITNLRAGEVKRGASSISMQVAASFDASLTRGREARSVSQKIDQAQAAWELERAWSKQQILETYLNAIYFRGELQGIGAASEQLFGKAPHGLSMVESSILAALIRSPQAPRAMVERRACEVLASLSRESECSQLAFAIDRWGSVGAGRDEKESIAPHVVKYLSPSPSRGGQGWGWGSADGRSTIDRPLQLAALDAIRKHLQILAGRNAHDAAVVVIDNATGEVLAYVGSSGQLSEAGEVDAARAPRQAGSTLKPFIYGLGIEKNLFTAATLLDDSPFSVDVGGGAYTPQNYAHEYVGPVSVRTALASSLNVPAIRALTLVGVAPAHATLKRAGLSTLVNDPDHYGFSLALGSADVNLLELTNAYRAIANGGVVTRVRFSPNVTPSPSIPPPPGGRETRLFSEPTAWLIAHILSDRGARYVTFGFDNPLSLSHWAAVKTGTSKDMRDNWAIGFNTRVTVGVWVGNAQGLPMHNVTGVSGAGPIWADVMEAAAQRFGAGAAPKAPGAMVKRRIEFNDLSPSPLEGEGLGERGKLALAPKRMEPSRDEFFIRGTEPAATNADAASTTRIAIAAREATSQGARIVSPTDGAIIAIDPDIPAANQRIALKSGDAAQANCWEVNGERLGCSEKTIAWSPNESSSEKNTIRLLDANGEERDRVTLYVRGKQQSNR
jgi:penicillin-binding protein 1C